MKIRDNLEVIPTFAVETCCVFVGVSVFETTRRRSVEAPVQENHSTVEIVEGAENQGTVERRRREEKVNAPSSWKDARKMG